MRQWISEDILTNAQATKAMQMFHEQSPAWGAFDTETDGLHIALSNPFLFQFGWLHPTAAVGYSFTVDIEQQPQLAGQVIRHWSQQCAPKLKKYFAHNVTFDLHMLQNYGQPYLNDNLSDSMFYIRHAHDAVPVRKGGPPLGLKAYAAQYIDPTAKHHDSLLQAERTAKAAEYNKALQTALNKQGPPEGAKSWTKKALNEIFKDPLADGSWLPTTHQEAYYNWLAGLPTLLRDKVTGYVEPDMIPYNQLNRKVLKEYAHKDIVYVLEIVEALTPIIDARETWEGVELEEKLIAPLFEMQSVGFKTNVAYLEEAKEKVRDYILETRQLLRNLTGEDFRIGQHAFVKTMLNNMGAELESSQDEDMAKAKGRFPPDSEVYQVISLIQELRTLEKWYSTYILQYLKDLRYTDRLYTQVNSVGTVTGRVTSNFQQFPKHPIATRDGIELFHPRKMIEVSGGEHPIVVYLDYSQIELRIQALYTILVGEPDLNLCRAYMPFKCVRNGELFDYNNPEHLADWQGEWFLEEDPTTHWHPTDVHGATTTAATGLTPDHPDFKDLRNSIGKRTNFAKNYGAQFKKIWSMFPEKSEEEARRIDNAYYTAFPGVRHYHNYCYARANSYAYTTNLFGVKYYNVSGHNLINTLVQGSAAHLFKTKIRELYDFAKERGLKTRWQMQVHDELSWEWHKDDPPEVFDEFRRIMQDWPGALVPIVADMEATTTNWAEKVEIDDLQTYLSH